MLFGLIVASHCRVALAQKGTFISAYGFRWQSSNLRNIALSASWTPSYSNLVAYYKFDDAIGTTQPAEQTNAYTGTVIGGVTFGGSGVVGNAATFDGSTGYITAPYQVLNNLPVGTIMAWIYPTSVASAQICSHQNDGVGSYAIFAVGVHGGCGGNPGNPLAGTLGQVYWHGQNFRSTYQSPETVSSSSILTPNAWYHLAVTFSSSAVNIYINGVLDSFTSTINGFIPNDSATNVQICAWIAPGGYFLPTHFSGMMDDFSVWNTALSASSIAMIYNTQRSPPSKGRLSSFAHYILSCSLTIL